MKWLRSNTVRIILTVIAIWVVTSPAYGAIIVAGPTAHIPNLVLGDGDRVDLNPDPVTYLASATAAMQARLLAEFAGFTFTYHAGGLAGTLTLNQYKAASAGAHNGGGILEATYLRAATDPALASLHFIQMIDTNVPLGGATSPYIDPRPNDDTLPFYWTAAEAAAEKNAAAGTFRFFDFSKRNCRAHPDSIWWRGELILAAFDGVKNVDVYDGIKWGWDFKCAPEPSSLVLMLVGGLGVVLPRALRRGRQRNILTDGNEQEPTVSAG